MTNTTPAGSFSVSFEGDAAVIALGKGVLQEQLRLHVGKPANVRGEQKLPQVTRYMLTGTSNYQVSAPHFGAVRFRGVASNIDAIFRATPDSLPLRFEIHPGGNPSEVKMAFKNAARVVVDREGNLHIYGRQNALIMSAPEVYQSLQEMKVGVPATFTVTGNTIQFDIKNYEKTKELFIEPRFIPFTAAQATKQLARSMENAVVENAVQEQR